MAIITFWSIGDEETGKSMSTAAVATELAANHNLKVLALSTSFKNKDLEKCFWDVSKDENIYVEKDRNKTNVDSGIDGLVKAILSNRTSPELITNYTKIIYKDRLEILESTKSEKEIEYEKIKSVYPDMLTVANRYYDYIFVDLNKDYNDELTKKVLALSDIIVVNITQRMESINAYMKFKEEENLLKQNNIIVVVGRDDKFSKYNSKNLAKYLSEKEIFSIPYNTLFFEACNENSIAEFFLKFRKLNDMTDRNISFVADIRKISEKIIYKLQELQLRG